MQIERIASAAMRPGDGELSPLARICLVNCPDPDMLELIGRAFLAAAKELRCAIGEVGHA